MAWRLATAGGLLFGVLAVVRAFPVFVQPTRAPLGSAPITTHWRRDARPYEQAALPSYSPTPQGSLGLAPAAAALIVAAVVSAGKHTRARRVAMRGTGGGIFTRPDQVLPWRETRHKKKLETGIGFWAEKMNGAMSFRTDEKTGMTRASYITIMAIKKGGNIVTGKKWPERHGKYAVQVGYDRFSVKEEKDNLKIQKWKRKRVTFCRSIKQAPLKKLKEFNMRPVPNEVQPYGWDDFYVGQKLRVSDYFKEGDIIEICGYTQDQGLQGRIARWGQKRGPPKHPQGSKHVRRQGAVGAGFKNPGRILPGKKQPGWTGGKSKKGTHTIVKLIEDIDEDNMPETLIAVTGCLPGYSAWGKQGGSYLTFHKPKKEYQKDGRNKADPVYMWYARRGDDEDPWVPTNNKTVWVKKEFHGRDIRWLKQQEKQYWPDGFPGYDHSYDPFHDDCDPKLALKAPEW